MSTPIALIGLASMGAALANCLLNSGQAIRIWNRTSTRPAIQDLVDKGAHLAPSILSTVKPCSVVVVCVLDYAGLTTILANADAESFKDKPIINLTNGTISEADAMSDKMLQVHGVAAYFDGAIVTTPKLVGTEASFLFCSGGSADLFEGEVSRVLGYFGKADYLGAEPGAAALHDLALLAAMYGMFDGTLPAIGLLAQCVGSSSLSKTTEQGPVTSIVSSRLVPMLEALLPALVGRAEQVEIGADSAGDHPNDMMAQGLRNIVKTCDDAGVDAGAAKHLLSVFELVEREGGGKGGMGLVGRKYFR